MKPLLLGLWSLEFSFTSGSCANPTRRWRLAISPARKSRQAWPSSNHARSADSRVRPSMLSARALYDGNNGVVRIISGGGERGAFVIERSGFLQEIIVAAAIRHQLAGMDVQDLGGEMPDKMDVVRDEDQCALV